MGSENMYPKADVI
jgi:serine/threonine-protein phosphatase 2A regulatory subunit B